MTAEPERKLKAVNTEEAMRIAGIVGVQRWIEGVDEPLYWLDPPHRSFVFKTNSVGVGPVYFILSKDYMRELLDATDA